MLQIKRKTVGRETKSTCWCRLPVQIFDQSFELRQRTCMHRGVLTFTATPGAEMTQNTTFIPNGRTWCRPAVIGDCPLRITHIAQEGAPCVPQLGAVCHFKE